MEVWRAEANQAFVDPSLQLAKNLPDLMRGHPLHKEMKLTDIDHMPIDALIPNVSNVSLFYSNKVLVQEGVKIDAGSLVYVSDPFNEPAMIDRFSWTTNKVWLVDVDGKPITTTAGEQIEHVEEVEYQAWHVEKKVPSYPKAFGLPTSGPRMFINSDTFKFDGDKFPPNTLLIRNIRAGRGALKNDFLYYPMAFDMMYNPDTWLVKKLNVGFLSLQPVMIVPKSGGIPRPVLKPFPIKVGKPEQYPVRPVPIQNEPAKKELKNWPTVDGMIFPEFISTDPIGAPSGFVDNALIDPKRLKEIWKKIELQFKTKTAIKFKDVRNLFA